MLVALRPPRRRASAAAAALLPLALAALPGLLLAFHIGLPMPSIPLAQDLDQRPPDGSTSAAGVDTPRPGLTLTLPPSGGSGQPGRRWSLDAASVHSESWELLSHRDGAHSHCGSSPRSLSPSDAYDSEGEGEAARRRATAAALLAALPVPGGAAAAAPEDDLVPFGSLVLDGRDASPLAAAVAADGSAPASPTAALPARAGSGSGSHVSSQPGSPVLGPGSVPPSVDSSPRSSYERPSSHASRLDLYSLSQVRLAGVGGQRRRHPAGWVGLGCPGGVLPPGHAWHGHAHAMRAA